MSSILTNMPLDMVIHNMKITHRKDGQLARAIDRSVQGLG